MEWVANLPCSGRLSPILPSHIMSNYLTVKEAAKLTGKSSSSIRRVIYPIIHDDRHDDRHHIEPTAEEAQALRVKGENFAWRISEELLYREVPITPPSEKPKTPSQTTDSGQGELLVMLREELQIKNQQIYQHSELIAKQMELISGLSERLREGNILIGSLQQRSALTEGTKRIKISTANAATEHHRVGESSRKSKSKPATKPVTKRRGFFRRIFG